ncbi:cysteine dioxygenase [Spirillospora albida]|uniref:cysteine dioxygenase n=1 Tax=Spirillospora albida TaxID=58123 RepID=UPI0004C17BF9|nr:cysteine dioxygenase [Spirillospora albida]
MVPDLTMRGQDDPHGRTAVTRPPTVGQLAAHVRDLAARPAGWWRRAAFDDGAPVRTELDGPDGARVWVTTWPPGHRGAVHGEHAGTTVGTLLAGELAEVVISADGVTERPLRPNRVRVHGGDRTHGLINPGPAYAVTLHASAG